MGFTVTVEQEEASTQIPNWFIQNYLPSANGNFIKVYLYLRMACQHPAQTGTLSVSMLADRMECTENDILRALRYWKREGLVLLSEKDSEITGITLCRPDFPQELHGLSSSQEKEAEAEPEEHWPPEEAPQRARWQPEILQTTATSETKVPDKQTYTPLQAEAFLKDAEINQTITNIEQLLGAPVSPAHLQLILYFMCDVGFSSELLVTLYETALKKDKKQPNYIESIGISWAKKGITTPEQAREEAASFSGKYALVTRALGINRSLAPAERTIIDGWESYHFADSIIDEACRRTVLQTGDTDLRYVSRILEDWHKQNVISLQDIEKCDEAFKRQRKNSGSSRKNSSRKNQFQNFPQRAYSQGDYDSLERRLLQGPKAEKA
ncbi:MAG: DnaD domain protein [Lachnospiraceae bacterium]|nr:DnaD domain protein [Lachnospiraceae bacterium]